MLILQLLTNFSSPAARLEGAPRKLSLACGSRPKKPFCFCFLFGGPRPCRGVGGGPHIERSKTLGLGRLSVYRGDAAKISLFKSLGPVELTAELQGEPVGRVRVEPVSRRDRHDARCSLAWLSYMPYGTLARPGT